MIAVESMIPSVQDTNLAVLEVMQLKDWWCWGLRLIPIPDSRGWSQANGGFCSSSYCFRSVTGARIFAINSGVVVGGTWACDCSCSHRIEDMKP